MAAKPEANQSARRRFDAELRSYYLEPEPNECAAMHAAASDGLCVVWWRPLQSIQTGRTCSGILPIWSPRASRRLWPAPLRRMLILARFSHNWRTRPVGNSHPPAKTEWPGCSSVDSGCGCTVPRSASSGAHDQREVTQDDDCEPAHQMSPVATSLGRSAASVSYRSPPPFGLQRGSLQP